MSSKRKMDDSSEEGEVTEGKVEYDASLKSKLPTPVNSSCEDATSERRRIRPQLLQQSIYGRPTEVETSGNFPSPAATLGPWFCLGQLGKGTFSSIHKCIHLGYYSSVDSTTQKHKPRVAAAKVELITFAQSGVLEAEAGVLDFLHRSLPAHTVPTFLGFYRCTATTTSGAPSTSVSPAIAPAPNVPVSAIASALVMEHLPGDDMHKLREAIVTKTNSRRIEIEDAVYLTAEVMLPLLQRLHSVGIVHRDVKPSNCVLRQVTPEGAQFCLVDFGLSKSTVVPEDSPLADKNHFWTGSHWQKPSNYSRRGCFRIPREKAEFRGTSMYASLRVHQLHDYCPRDDMWSLMYVFCDLVTGGLPWMQHAANRDRAACQQIKERVHGHEGQQDQTESLLLGEAYHVAKFRKDRHEAAAMNGDAAGSSQGSSQQSKTIELPPPLPLSQDKRLVDLLREVFSHLGRLEFSGMPDYDLIQRCLRGFSTTQCRPPPVPRISYTISSASPDRGHSTLLEARKHIPRDYLPDDSDPLDEEVFDDVEETTEETSVDRLAILPLELRYRLAQMEYHASRPDRVPPIIAHRDWMKVTIPLVYGEWDTPKYEGRHRTSTDGLKRDLFLHLLSRCQTWAAAFGDFRVACDESKPTTNGDTQHSSALDNEDGDMQNYKKRCTDGFFVNVTRALFGLERAIQMEDAKKSGAQATRITFS